MLKVKIFLLIAAALIPLHFLQADDDAPQAIRVSKPPGQTTRNPTVIYKGIRGAEGDLSNTILNFIKACDWFDVKSSGPVDYTIDGEFDGSRVALQIVNEESNAGNIFRISYPGPAHHRLLAKNLVDAMLKKLFNVEMCNSKIAFCADTGYGIRNIFICDIDGGDVQQITNYQTLCVEPSWSPDSKSLIYSMYGPSYIDVVQTNLNPLRTRRLVSYPGLNSSTAISPNGKYLALIMSFDKQVDLYVKELESDRKIRLTKSNAVEASPSWNPGGGSLVFVSDQNGSPKLFKIDINTKQMTALYTEGSEAVSPEWNAEDVIIYTTRMGNYTLAILNMGYTSPARSGILIKVGGDWESPSWAPDNRHVVCSRKIDGRSSLYLVDSWTGNFRQITNFRYNQSTPSWSNLSK